MDEMWNPREWDNLGTMVCWHRRYILGDEQGRGDPFKHLAMLNRTRAVYLPLYLLDHSGLAMSTESFNDPWDSGQVGWISVSLDKLRREYGWQRVTKARRAKVLEYLQNEVNEYDEYLSG